MAFDGFFALILRLATGILAVQDPGQPVGVDDALAWATAVAYHSDRNHLDPFEMVGIARNETDFRPALIGPDGKDCGITQTRVTYSRYRCAQLRQDPWLAFEEAARELSENQARCSRTARGDLVRCRLNSYNSGVHYARTGWNGTYWLRVSCFAEAARRGLRPIGDCRSVRDRGDIARIIERSEALQAVTVAAAPSPSPKARAPRPLARARAARTRAR